MWKAVRENPRAVTYAVLIHVGLLALLVFSLDWTPKVTKPGTVIQATLVDSRALQAVEEKKQAEQRRIDEQQRKLKQEQQRKLEAERKQKAEQEKKRKAEAERKKKTEQDKKRKVEAERKKKAGLAAKKKAEEKRKAEAKQKAEQQHKAEEKRKAEAKRKAEEQRKAEAKRKAEAEAARRKEAEAALQAQLAEEQAQARATDALSKYIPYIQDKIQRNWLRPSGSRSGLSCLILVRLIPGGEVVSATVVRSSGDALFDRSVETAVLKASPLPLPEDASMFKYFREINFEFKPDN